MIFLAAFTTVFLLVFQQQNVVHKLYLWAVLTSFGITLGQVYVIKVIADNSDLTSIFLMMGGGAAGVVASMFLHGRLVEYYNRSLAK